MNGAMRLKVVMPTGVAVDTYARKILAEGAEGAFGILPRHIDFVSRLVPGVLIHEDAEGREGFLGVNEGTLVKCGAEVLVSTRDAIPGRDLAALQRRVAEAFLEIDEQERVARSALARLEAGFIRRFMDLEKAQQ